MYPFQSVCLLFYASFAPQDAPMLRIFTPVTNSLIRLKRNFYLGDLRISFDEVESTLKSVNDLEKPPSWVDLPKPSEC